MSEDLNALLDGYQANTLTGIAAANDIEVTENGRALPKAKMVARLREALFGAERIREVWRALDDRERRIAGRLLLHAGEVNTRAFKRELLRAGLVDPTPSQARQSYGRVAYAGGYIGSPKRGLSWVFEDVIARLTQRGLVFSRAASPGWNATPYKLEYHPGAVLLVPETVRQVLPVPEPPPPALAGWRPDSVEEGAPDLLLRDLYLYWEHVRRVEAPLVQSGHVSKRWLKTLNDLLLSPDASLGAARREDETERLALLRQLLEGLGLVRSQGRALRVTGDPLGIPTFWGMSPLAQRRACMNLWPMTTERLDTGLLGVDPVFLPDAKRALLNSLEAMPLGVWLTPEELLDRASTARQGGLLTDADAPASGHYSYYGNYDRGDGELLESENDRELRFVQACLGGFLLEIGLVELGDAGGERHGFRLSTEAPALLSGASEASDRARATPGAEGGNVIVQPNYQVLAIGPVPLSVLAQLDLCAERQRAGRAAFEYRLSRESVYGAQQLGMSATEVARLLEDVSGVELPQNVARTLAEWGAHHERIVIRDGMSLLHAADAKVLESLTGDDRIQPLGLRLLTPEIALVRRDRQEQLVALLLDRGLLPAISDLKPESADNSVHVAPDGTIEAIHAVPSLYLRDRLALFAERLGETHWRLTPRSVRRAGGSKVRVLRLLDELGALQRGSLSDELIETIRAWGGYYGAAAVQALTVVEFHDQETLDELLQRPELRGDLLPLAPGRGKRALAVIADGRRERVEETLLRLGVRLEGTIVR